MSGVNMDSSYQSMITDATTTLTGVQKDASTLLQQVRGTVITDAKGTVLGPFNNLEDYRKALSQPGVKITPGDVATILGSVNDVMAKVDGAKKLIESLKAGMSEQTSAMNAMMELLKSGDIEGAVMMLQTSRAKVLEQQLGTRIEGMQARNAQIKTLNDQLKVEQGKLGNVTGTAEEKQAARDNINATITGLKGDMDKLNSDSQLDMIGIQGLVNKRNEAFDMLTNLLGKFQKTIDGIVGNMR